MKKINTETKLRITNNKTKLIIERTPTGAWEDFKDATGAKEAGQIVANLAKTAAKVTKLFGLELLPIKALGKQLKDAVWLGKKFNWDAFKADYKRFAKKGYDQFKKDVDELVKDHENNFKSMLTSGMGMTEGEADALMFAGSPPIAIMNKLYDLSKNKRKDGDVSDFAKIKQLNELIPRVIYIYITGLNPDKADGSSALISEIKTKVYNKYMGNLGQNCKEIIEYLHREKYFKRHFEPILDKCKSIYNEFNFDLNVVASIDDAGRRVDDTIITEFVRELKEYCDRNNEKVESFSKKSLNLKTMLIKEADADGDDPTGKKDMSFDQIKVHNLGLALSLVFIRMNSDEIKKLLIKDVSGLNVEKFNRVLENRNTIMTNMAVFFLFCLNKKILMGLADEFIADGDYDFKTQGKSYYETAYDSSINGFDDQYKTFFTSAKEKSQLYLALDKPGTNNKDTGYAIYYLLAGPKLKQSQKDAKLISTFNWDKLVSERIVETLFETELCNDSDVPFLKAVQSTLNEYNEATKDNTEKSEKLKDALDAKFKPPGGGSSTGS